MCYLAATGRVSRQIVEKRLGAIAKAERLIISSSQALYQAFDSVG
ncbi:hypothetical protein [Prosthecobacter debontii]|nr:hypothetical protein [Prosthecobacter debontii]